MRHRVGIVLFLALMSVPLTAETSRADGPCDRLEVCAPDVEGIVTGSRREDVINLPKGPGGDASGAFQPAANAPRFEYGSTTACLIGALPGEPGADVMCNGAVMGLIRSEGVGGA